MERSADFAISIYDERLVADNARDRFDESREFRRRVEADGLMASGGSITKKGWDVLSNDSMRLERNALRWLRSNFRNVRDEGHDSHGDLVGVVWFNTDEQASLIELGTTERIDMVDLSFGDLAKTVWDGVSDFGANVLGGAIHFREIDEYSRNSDNSAKGKAARSANARRAAAHTVCAPIESVWMAAGIRNPLDDDEYLHQYAWEQTGNFLREWAEEFEEPFDIPEEVRTEVEDAIWGNISKDAYEKYTGWLVDAITECADEAGRLTEARGSVAGVSLSQGELCIDIASPFLKMWRTAIEGEGYAAWGGDERLTDVKSVAAVLNVLDMVARVYGSASVARCYESAVNDRWEPETGRYYDLSKIAERALARVEGSA